MTLWLTEKSPNLAEGELTVTVAGEPVWVQDDDETGETKPVEWYWVDLLYHLGRVWGRLEFEESYPLGLLPPSPVDLNQYAARRWAQMVGQQDLIVSEDEAVFRFNSAHNLARGLPGISVPALWFMRMGQLMWVCGDSSEVQKNCDEVLKIIRDFCDYLVVWLERSPRSEARRACAAWKNRHSSNIEQRAIWATGIPSNELEEIGLPLKQFEVNPTLFALARMSYGSVDKISLKHILARVEKTPHRSTPQLDSLGALMKQKLDGFESTEPYVQGYVVANSLRTHLELRDDVTVDPEKILQDYNVQIKKQAFPTDSSIEALAVWGPSHGPLILYNSKTARKEALTRRRATMAHELCHLLIDRDAGLPLGDVIGGNSPPLLEKRARAFAAEFLLPRNHASRQVKESPDIEHALRTLARDFNVSEHLAANQIRNSRAFRELSEGDKRRIERRSDSGQL